MARMSKAEKEAKAKAEAAKQEALKSQATEGEEGTGDTGTNTPNTIFTGANDAGTEGNSEGSDEGDAGTEGNTESEAPEPMEEEGEVVQDYSAESVAKVLVIDDDEFLTKRIAARLSNFCVIVIGPNDIAAMPSAANNMADLVGMINKSNTVQFIKIIKGLTEFINDDLETFGNKSPFFGIRPFRPFLGGCPPACSFLEAIQRLSPTKTRKKTIKSFDPTALNKFLNEDKKELFISYFSE
ncbi:hypothetical protein TSMG0028 [Halocynthia phage JM-2012]|uniref:hypothetical protein n=1 Tax=Halocynthia phage JM-2012 TaxID=1173297 RepID=UPI00025C68EB|nr:hypothetical protein TSMG0028 [Halocynthia phage JM-2012]AFI55311.1 hypothetical protein TSMG0028 [Halocynthia phage JM-2012]